MLASRKGSLLGCRCTPMVQGGSDGRDHHPNAFTMWMAGGGVKRGFVMGETDELGFS